MIINRNHRFHTSHGVIHEPCFVGSPTRNQPKEKLYRKEPLSKDWYQREFSRILVGIPAYHYMNNMIEHGFNGQSIVNGYTNHVPEMINKSPHSK